MSDPTVEAHIDYSTGAGYFVRVDMEVEQVFRVAKTGEPTKSSWAVINAAEAADLGARLLSLANEVERLRTEEDARRAKNGSPPRDRDK